YLLMLRRPVGAVRPAASGRRVQPAGLQRQLVMIRRRVAIPDSFHALLQNADPVLFTTSCRNASSPTLARAITLPAAMSAPPSSPRATLEHAQPVPPRQVAVLQSP